MLPNLLKMLSSARHFLDRIIINGEILVLYMSINNDNGHHPLNMNYLPANLDYNRNNYIMLLILSDGVSFIMNG